MGKGFSVGEESWRAGLGTLRQVVRQELVTRQLAAHLTAGQPERRSSTSGAARGRRSWRWRGPAIG